MVNEDFSEDVSTVDFQVVTLSGWEIKFLKVGLSKDRCSGYFFLAALAADLVVVPEKSRANRLLKRNRFTQAVAVH